MKRALLLLSLLWCALLTAAGTGCQILRNYGSGTHLNAPENHPHDPNPTRVREMVVEVTTDAEGNVAEIHFQRSSGKDGIDAYVAESIRQGWPRKPSTKSVASLTYSTEKGFSTPKMISTTPVG